MPPQTFDVAEPLPRRVLFVFLDGVGIGPADPARNPFAAAELRNLRRLTEGRLPVREELADGPVFAPGVVLAGIDATLDVEGLPQSGTGQTALLTGTNAADRLGRHFGPWVPTSLRAFLRSESLFQRAVARGLSVAVANAYPRADIDRHREMKRPGAFPHAAAAAGLLQRDELSVREGKALVSSITTDRWRLHIDPDAPEISPGDAGARLASISAAYDLTVFAHFDTDFVGHRGQRSEAIAAVECVDEFLGGIVEHLQEDTLLLVTSDHGNLEDATGGHTRNPVLLLTVGRGSRQSAGRIGSILDVTPTILDLLSAGDPREGEGRAT